MDSKIFKILYYCSVVLNLFLIVSYLIYPIIGDDSGFYVSVARELYNGKIYFQEIGISYNPLSIIVFGIPYLFMDNPNYSFHLAINILIVLGSSLFLYKILKSISFNKIYNLFFTSLFISLSLVLDGKYVLLEPLSVFFQIAALYYYLEYLKKLDLKRIFLVGVFLSFAFLSKQYGLFIALPIGLDLLIRNRFKFKDLGILILGGLIPLAIFFCYLFYYGINLTEFINHILGKGVQLDTGNGTGIGTTFFSHPLDFVYVLVFNLYALIIPFLLLKYYRKLDEKKTIFILAAITSLSVLIFANYWHYYQYIIPFWILLFVYLFQKIVKNKFKVFVAFLFAVSLGFMGLYSGLSYVGKKKSIENQSKTSQILSKHIPANSEAYLDGLSPAYYYTNNLKSINLKKIGFSFPGYFYPQTIINNLKAGAFLVVSEKKFDLYKSFIADCSIEKMEANNQVYFIIMKKG